MWLNVTLDHAHCWSLKWGLPNVSVTLPQRHVGVVLLHNRVRKLFAQEGDIMLQLTDVQKCTLTIAPVDAAGNPAALDGAPAWTSSNPTVLDVVAGSDGLTAVVTALGPLGDSQVSVSADARVGPDVVTLTGTLDVNVAASEATTLGITAGTPEAK